MDKQSRQSVPVRLQRLEQRFAAWREKRVKGERIPKSLWNAAAKLASEFGIHKTASVLRLGYYSLKKRVESQSNVSDPGKSQNASQTTFVELPAPTMTPVNECVIEMEDGSGASMRMHLKGADVPDVLALGRSFWSGE